MFFYHDPLKNDDFFPIEFGKRLRQIRCIHLVQDSPDYFCSKGLAKYPLHLHHQNCPVGFDYGGFRGGFRDVLNYLNNLLKQPIVVAKRNRFPSLYSIADTGDGHIKLAGKIGQRHFQLTRRPEQRMGPSLLLTLINTILYALYLFSDSYVTFFKV